MDENQIYVYIEETPVEIPEYNAIELFKKATQVDKGNMFAREKLAQLELKNENYLQAAMQFENILDITQAEGCYKKALDTPEKFEKNGDFILRKGGDISEIKQLYWKSISILRKNPQENQAQIKTLFKKIYLSDKALKAVMNHFLKLSEEGLPIFPQSKVIKSESTEIYDGDINLDEMEDDAPGHRVEDLSDEEIKLFGLDNK